MLTKKVGYLFQKICIEIFMMFFSKSRHFLVIDLAKAQNKNYILSMIIKTLQTMKKISK